MIVAALQDAANVIQIATDLSFASIARCRVFRSLYSVKKDARMLFRTGPALLLFLALPVQAQEAAPYSRDTPMEKLAADPAAVAVLNKDLPGLLTAPEYAIFKTMSLKQLQQASGGDLSMVDLNKTEADLQALPGH